MIISQKSRILLPYSYKYTLFSKRHQKIFISQELVRISKKYGIMKQR